MKLSKVSTSPTKSSFETKENYIKVKIKMINDHLTLQICEYDQSQERLIYTTWSMMNYN